MCRQNTNSTMDSNIENQDMLSTQIQLFKQKMNQFISVDVIPTAAIRHKLTNSKWVNEGMMQELQSLVDKTMDDAGILSSEKIPGKKCAVM